MLDQIAMAPQRQEHGANLHRNGAAFAQGFADRPSRPGYELGPERVEHTDKQHRVADVLKPKRRKIPLREYGLGDRPELAVVPLFKDVAVRAGPRTNRVQNTQIVGETVTRSSP